MSPADLPTDNLYKFVALSGAVLAGFFVWLTWRTKREILAAHTELKARHARNKAAGERLLRLHRASANQSERLRSTLQHLKASAALRKPTPDDEVALSALEAAYAAHESELGRIDDEYDSIASTHAELDARADGLVEQAISFRQMNRMSMVAAMLAIGFSAGGFWLWYDRLQKPLDEKLRLEAEVAIHELRKQKVQLVTDVLRSVTGHE